MAIAFIYFCSCLHLFNYISNLCKGLFWSLMDLMKPHPCLNILKLIICLAFETHNFNVSAFLATAETPRFSACQCMPNAFFFFFLVVVFLLGLIKKSEHVLLFLLIKDKYTDNYISLYLVLVEFLNEQQFYPARNTFFLIYDCYYYDYLGGWLVVFGLSLISHCCVYISP